MPEQLPLDPHEAAPDEDPEAHIGPVVPDPWGPYVPRNGDGEIPPILNPEGL